MKHCGECNIMYEEVFCPLCKANREIEKIENELHKLENEIAELVASREV